MYSFKNYVHTLVCVDAHHVRGACDGKSLKLGGEEGKHVNCLTRPPTV